MLIRNIWQRYDALITDGDTSSARAHVFSPSYLSLSASPPCDSSCSASLHRCTVWVYLSATRSHLRGPHGLDSIAWIAATAVSAMFSNDVVMTGSEAGLFMRLASMKVQWCVSLITVLLTSCSFSPRYCLFC